MKTITRILTVVLTICVFLSTLTLCVSAADNAIIAFDKKTVEVGEKLTVTVTVAPGKKMYAVAYYLEYNDAVLKYESGTGVGEAGTLQITESPSGQESVKYTFTFSALKVGTSNISVTDCKYSSLGDGGANEVAFSGASAKVTVKDPELSDNAKLKSLKVSGYKLSPSFSSSKTSYTLKVPYETEKINVSATTSSSAAKVISVKGNTDLKVGSNTVTVTVEAENGTQKKYTIKVTRLEKEEEKETESEETSQEEKKDENALETTIDGAQFSIATKIPQEVLFKGFTIETAQVNGYDIETAVDSDGNYRLFYLQSADSEDYVPYLYDQETDQFEILKYAVFGENYYIFSSLPDDYTIPETMYTSSINIGGFSVDCLSDSNTEMSDFHYLYCYCDGAFNLYRFDAVENTLQRFPDFEQLFIANEQDNSDSFLSRFSTLSTNGKVIIIAFIIVILGIFALLIMLIVYLIRRSMNRSDDMILSSIYEDFDQIEIEEEASSQK